MILSTYSMKMFCSFLLLAQKKRTKEKGSQNDHSQRTSPTLPGVLTGERSFS